MKKKIFSLIIVFVMLITLTGCGSEETNERGNAKVDLKTNYVNAEFHELTYKVGEIYQTVENGKSKVHAYDTYDENAVHCNLSILVEDGEYDAEEAIHYSTLSVKNMKYSKQTINGKEWTVGTGSNDRKYKAYSIGKNKKQYTIVYEYDNEGCVEHIEEFEKSLNVK